MRILIRGDWVVGWSGDQHELIADGVCVVEDDRIVYVGKSYDGPADREIGGPGCLVSPGLISTHLHAGFNARDYVYLDQDRPDTAGRNYLNWQAGLADAPRYEPEVGPGVTFGLAQCLQSGITTVLEVGAAGDAEAFCDAADAAGIRVYTGLSYRNASMFSEPDGNFGYRWDDVTEKFQSAIALAERLDAGEYPRISPILCPGHPDTCELAVLEETARVAHDKSWPVTIHAGLHLKEFDRSYLLQRSSPYEILAKVGLLGPHVILAHAMFHRRHSWSPYAGDDLRLMAEHGAIVSHSPIKYAHLGVQLESLQRYHDAGITVTMGTDMAPSDIIAEMRMAMLASRVADRSFLSAAPRLVFDAATVNAADALGRADLGRLVEGAKADVTVFDLAALRFGAVHDPIRSLVESGSSADVRWTLVDGAVLVDDRRLTTIDVEELLTEAQNEGRAIWDDVPNWYPGGRGIDEIVPPAYPIR